LKAGVDVVSTFMIFAECAKHGAATSLGTEESSPWERGSSNDVVHGGNYCVVMTGINELFP
jgi:hypothetical protein